MVLHLKAWESRSLPGLLNAKTNDNQMLPLGGSAIVLGPFFTRLPKRRLSLTAQAAFLFVVGKQCWSGIQHDVQLGVRMTALIISSSSGKRPSRTSMVIP